MNEKKITEFPDLIEFDGFEDTRPMTADDIRPELSVERQMAIIGAHHERIRKAIEMFWGHRDCVAYIEQLILNGGDGVDRARIGFKQEVLTAMINLIELHKVKPD